MWIKNNRNVWHEIYSIYKIEWPSFPIMIPQIFKVTPMCDEGKDIYHIDIRNICGSHKDIPTNSKICKKCLKLAKKRTDTDTDTEILSGKKPDDMSLVYKEIIDDLNRRSGKNFRWQSKNTQTQIAARMKEGFTVEDFKKVHTNKTADWLGDEKMSRFLRPETLYRPGHFESYLNENHNDKLSKFSPKTQRTIKNIAQAIGELEGDDGKK